MRLDVFEALAPCCPRCLHTQARESPLVVAERGEMRAGRLWHGVLHCSNPECWLEFPVLDGAPVITADPRATLRMAERHLLARDLPGSVASLIGDALGPGTEFDTARQHLSIYAHAHVADWSGQGPSALARVAQAALAAAPAAPDGPALDLGGGPGRGAWEIAATGRTVLSCDLNLSFLRFAQRLAVEGRAPWPLRRIGLVYDPAEAVLPQAHAGLAVDFWALDAMALPFPAGRFAQLAALNLLDCVPSPAGLIAEAARVAMAGAAAVFTTPYDWSAAVPEIAGWLGGHSQRAAQGGAGEPVLTATLAREGLAPVAERDGIAWDLRLHARSVMQYRLHLVACTKRPA